MPCDSGPSYYDEDRQESATQVLCEIVATMRKVGVWSKVQSKLSKKAKRWVEDHDAEDAERGKREAEEVKKKELRRKALAKLTPAERRAINAR